MVCVRLRLKEAKIQLLDTLPEQYKNGEAMVDHTYRCIFIHQRKVAGCSIISAFDKHPSMPDWHLYNAGVLGRRWKNLSFPENTYFVFSAVRNPFDRVVSAWKYLPKFRTLSLAQVLRQLPQEGHDYRHLTQSQIALIQDPATGKLVVDDLIRFESLQSDFDRICDHLGKPRRLLERLKVGNRDREYRKYYDTETRGLVENFFREDLQRFDYEF